MWRDVINILFFLLIFIYYTDIPFLKINAFINEDIKMKNINNDMLIEVGPILEGFMIVKSFFLRS